MKNVLKLVYLEVSGKVFITIGIIFEIIYQAPVYLILITVGSLFICVAAEVKLYGKRGE